MLGNLRTLNNLRKASPNEIEIQFEQTRENYLKDLDKVRKKYAMKFMKLSSMYSNACLNKV